MVRWISILIFIACFNMVQSQESFIRKGLLRFQATLAPSVMIGQHTDNIHLHADIEYFPEDRLSLRADSYIYLLSLNEKNLFKHYYSAFAGAAYHFPVNNFDFSFSFQPGIGIIQTSEQFQNDIKPIEPELQAVPMMAVGTGVNFFIHKNFHFLTHIKFIKGTYSGDLVPLKINEFIFSAGLGWNLNIK